MPCAPSPAMPCRMQQLRYISTSAASSSLTGTVGIKAELRALLADLSSRHGPVAALLPGLQEDKARIDELLQQLAASPDNSSSSSSSDAANDLGPQPLDGNVMGEWELVYASNGTVRHPTHVVFGFHQTPPSCLRIARIQCDRIGSCSFESRGEGRESYGKVWTWVVSSLPLFKMYAWAPSGLGCIWLQIIRPNHLDQRVTL